MVLNTAENKVKQLRKVLTKCYISVRKCYDKVQECLKKALRNGPKSVNREFRKRAKKMFKKCLKRVQTYSNMFSLVSGGLRRFEKTSRKC